MMPGLDWRSRPLRLHRLRAPKWTQGRKPRVTSSLNWLTPRVISGGQEFRSGWASMRPGPRGAPAPVERAARAERRRCETEGELPAYDSLITPRMLLGHLGGIHRYGRSGCINSTSLRSVRASLAKFVNDPLVAVPGTKYVYSSYAYVLLGAAIEATEQRPLTSWRE